MNQVRSHARRYGLLWVLFLASALVFIQTTNVHMHVYDHYHADTGFTAVHEHLDSAHVCDNICDSAHGHDSVVAMDITPEGGMKFPSFASLVIALLTTGILSLLFPVVRRRVPKQRHEETLYDFWRHAIRPPLRAPPL